MNEPPSSQEQRQWAMFAHLSSFIGWMFPFGNVIAPLVIWQMQKDQMPFAADQAKECLNFQILVTILAIVCIPLVFILIGVPLLLGLIVFDTVVTIIAAIESNEGVTYRYPLNVRFIQ